MTNHPNRSTARRIKWHRGYNGELIATWPNGSMWAFSRPGGAYVFCDMGRDDKPGTLGKQICYGGGLRGSTIEADSDDEFVRVVKKWLADYRRSMIGAIETEELM